MLLTQTSQLDTLGLKDTPQHHQGEVYKEFQEQLLRRDEGWYETALPWKGNHPPLPSHKQGSLHWLENLKQKLKQIGVEEAYSEVIEQQKAEAIVEAADHPFRGLNVTSLINPVIREAAASIKVSVVYNAYAKAHPNDYVRYITVK